MLPAVKHSAVCNLYYVYFAWKRMNRQQGSVSIPSMGIEAVVEYTGRVCATLLLPFCTFVCQDESFLSRNEALLRYEALIHALHVRSSCSASLQHYTSLDPLVPAKIVCIHLLMVFQFPSRPLLWTCERYTRVQRITSPTMRLWN